MTMKASNAKIIIANLIDRIVYRDGRYVIDGVITPSEVEALRVLAGSPPDEASSPKPTDVATQPGASSRKPVLDCLSADEPVTETRLCMDFGTARSKAVAVTDDRGHEIVFPLALGKAAGQLVPSDVMLVSALYVSGDGRLWFGQDAEDAFLREGSPTSRSVLRNIKRFLSDGDIDAPAGVEVRGTEAEIKYRDLLLAYLAFFTRVTNKALEEQGLSRYCLRRFAIPCLIEPRRSNVVRLMSGLLGQAQVIADSYGDELLKGPQIVEFLGFCRRIESVTGPFRFITDEIPEPVAVAGSILSHDDAKRVQLLVIDVGAGTTDIGLFKIAINPSRQRLSAMYPQESLKIVTEAGDYLDRCLFGHVLKRAGLVPGAPGVAKKMRDLQQDMRSYKETLFNEGSVMIPIDEDTQLEILRDEFTEIDGVKQMTRNIREKIEEIFETVDREWIADAQNGHIMVALTGGGGGLPMLKELTTGFVISKDRSARASLHPLPIDREWIEEVGISVESYPQLAVSFGGARGPERLIVINPGRPA